MDMVVVVSVKERTKDRGDIEISLGLQRRLKYRMGINSLLELESMKRRKRRKNEEGDLESDLGTGLSADAIEICVTR